MLLLWLTATLSGCTGELDQESFIDRYTKEACKALQECDRAYFLDAFGDVDECREEYSDILEDIFDDGDCDFEPEEGQRCIDGFSEYRDTCDYDDIESDDCADAFGCKVVTEPTTYSYTYRYYDY